jgi:hypothetical protein
MFKNSIFVQNPQHVNCAISEKCKHCGRFDWFDSWAVQTVDYQVIARVICVRWSGQNGSLDI